MPSSGRVAWYVWKRIAKVDANSVKPMITIDPIRLLYDYHYWANARMLDACEALTTEQWDRPHGHSWDSLHGMFAHMLAAEVIWLSRWTGVSPTSLLKPEEVPTLADVRRMWAGWETDLRRFVDACDDARLNSPLEYRTTRGEPQSVMLGVLMLHLANHGTHHRGELAAMLTLLNVLHPEDDLILYARAKQKQK
jgi:uncharacterized damage-inducible protein DinB